MSHIDNKIGKKYNDYEVINFIGVDNTRTKTEKTRWLCRCKCGKLKNLSAHTLVTGRAKNCGCDRKYWSKPNGHSDTTGLINIYKNSAKERGFVFELKRAEFEKLILDNCFYCGKAPSAFYKACQGKKGGGIYYNGIDRLNPNLGYEMGNVVSCCKECNYSKRTRTLEEFKEWVIKVYNSLIKVD